MSFPSETETTMRLQVGQVLEALPAIRRWLVRSAHSHPGGAGHASMPLSHIRTLLHLSQFGPMTIGELARGLGVSYSTATECAASLETRGRVLKQRAPSDRRQVVVSVTPEAQEVVSVVLAKRRGAVERVLKQLSPSERRTFIKGLTLLARDLEGEVDGVAQLDSHLSAVKDSAYAA